jgi:glycosyltransferase involved in cell wall biosynthesis
MTASTQSGGPTGYRRTRRIAHVTDCYLPRMGGIERQVAGLSAQQIAAGDEVDIFTTVGDRTGSSTVDAATVHRPATARGPLGRIRYGRTREVLDRLDPADYDLIHVHLSTFSPLAARQAAAARRHGVPTVATLHSMLAGAKTGFAAADHLLAWSRWPVGWSAVSSVAARDLRAFVDRPVAVLPNGVDTAFWRPVTEFRPAGGLAIATVMRLASRKRPVQFVNMLARLRRSVPAGVPITVRIIGDGPLRPRVAELIVRHGMQRWVSLDGQLSSEAIRSAFASANLYVAPAVHESFGIAALEAHSAGLPVVSFAASGVRDIVGDGATGRLVADDDGMVAAMADLAARPEELARLARAAVTSEPRFDWASVRARADALYADVRAQTLVAP